MKRTVTYLFLSLVLHGLLFIPIHFSKQKTYKVDGQNQIVQARLIIAEPISPQTKTMSKALVEASTQSLPLDKSAPSHNRANDRYRLPRQVEESSMDLVTTSAKKGVLKKQKKELIKKSASRVLNKKFEKPQQKKLSGEQTNQLITIIYQTVHKNKVYPLQSRRLHHQGKVLIAFSLLPTGHINNVKVRKSSGYSDLDKAALKALSASQPFKVEQLLSSKQDIAIPIVYRLAKK